MLNHNIKQRAKSTNVMIESPFDYDVFTAVMLVDGEIYPFDTTNADNIVRYYGVIIEVVDRRYTIGWYGETPTNLPDGDYFADSSGVLVNALPGGSFDHKIGFAEGGYFKFAYPISTEATPAPDNSTFLGYTFGGCCGC